MNDVLPAPLALYLREYRRRTLRPVYHHSSRVARMSVQEAIGFLDSQVDIRLHGETVMLMLYYGTTLQAGEICRISSSCVRRPQLGTIVIESSNDGAELRQVELDVEVGAVLDAYLARLAIEQFVDTDGGDEAGNAGATRMKGGSPEALPVVEAGGERPTRGSSARSVTRGGAPADDLDAGMLLPARGVGRPVDLEEETTSHLGESAGARGWTTDVLELDEDLEDEPSRRRVDDVVSVWDRGLRDEEGRLFRKGDGSPYSRSEVHGLLTPLGDDAEYSQFDHFFPIYHETDYGVVPTRLRMNSDTRYTGRGVTIAFIDSGFYPHPDLTKPRNRIRAYVNIANPRKDDFGSSEEDSWHGMQTSVSAAGNGYLSKGLYKGIAPHADVVLLKVRGRLGIQPRHIIDALEWVVEHREAHNIRIVNISLSGDRPGSYLRSALDQAAEGAIQAGIVVVASAGNRGGEQGSEDICPPASAPSVITVGGLNDNNQLDTDGYQMYWSSYGPTLDGILKPEIVAPGIWVAAPILPGSQLSLEARWIFEVRTAPDDEVAAILRNARADGVDWPEEMDGWSLSRIRGHMEEQAKRHKLVSPDYQHVDGTSFSSPIVCSVIAQMLEANPSLSPTRVKDILTDTTDKIYNVPIRRQGHGLIHPRKAVKEAVNDLYRAGFHRPPSPRVRGRVSTFYYEDSEAKEVSLAGEFNGWSATSHPMKQISTGLWSVDYTFDTAEWYGYKYVINGTQWVTDPENLNREPDGYGGWNARVNIMM